MEYVRERFLEWWDSRSDKEKERTLRSPQIGWRQVRGSLSEEEKQERMEEDLGRKRDDYYERWTEAGGEERAHRRDR